MGDRQRMRRVQVMLPPEVVELIKREAAYFRMTQSRAAAMMIEGFILGEVEGERGREGIEADPVDYGDLRGVKAGSVLGRELRWRLERGHSLGDE